MLTLEQISWVLKTCNQSVFAVTIIDNSVGAKLESRLDLDQPYYLVVEPIQERQMLRILAFPILKTRWQSSLFRILTRINFGLRFGNLSIRPNGELMFKDGIFCEDNDSSPSPTVLDRLLNKYIDELRLIEKFLLMSIIAEAGIPRKRARQTAETLLADE